MRLARVVRADKLEEREKRIEVRPYGHVLHLVVSNNVVKSMEKRKLSGRPSEPAYAFVWTRKGCADVYLFIPPECNIGAIAHEVWHVVYSVLSSVGVRIGDDTEEVVAYHLDDLVQQAAAFVLNESPRKCKSHRKSA